MLEAAKNLSDADRLDRAVSEYLDNDGATLDSVAEKWGVHRNSVHRRVQRAKRTSAPTPNENPANNELNVTQTIITAVNKLPSIEAVERTMNYALSFERERRNEEDVH